jgi:hypothetical protein
MGAKLIKSNLLSERSQPQNDIYCIIPSFYLKVKLINGNRNENSGIGGNWLED